MLTLPFRLAATLFIALFCASSLVRRAVAGVAISAFIVALQHDGTADLLAASGSGDLSSVLTVLAELYRG
jgi:hypothetical protein